MSRNTYRLATCLAMLATGQMAQAQTRPCMTQAELHGMVAYVLPSAMTAVVERCRASLPAGSAMLTRGPQLATELEAGQSAAFPMARKAFAKFSDKGDDSGAAMMMMMPEAALRPIIEGALSQQLTSSIKVKDCPDIDRVFGTLRPLPASNFVDLFTQVIAISARDNKQMSVCPA